MNPGFVCTEVGGLSSSLFIAGVVPSGVLEGGAAHEESNLKMQASGFGASSQASHTWGMCSNTRIIF